MLVIRDIWLCHPACRCIHDEEEISIIFDIRKDHAYRLHKYGLRALGRTKWDASYFCPHVQDVAYEMQVPIVINYGRPITKNERVSAFLELVPGSPTQVRPMFVASWAGYVYLMHWQGLYKIGMSKNPEKRLKGINVPGKVELMHKVYSHRMLVAERALHQQFAEYRTDKEWFSLPPDVVTWFCALDPVRLRGIVGC